MYENAYDSCYEELKTYYPVWYQEIKEMDAIWRVMGDELDDVQNGIVHFVLSCYIQSADEETLARWERFLWVAYDGERSLSERRNMILQFFTGYGHIGQQEITEIVGAFTTGQILVDLVGGTVEITVTRDLAEKFILSDCLFILKKKIPNHLGIVFNDVILPIRFYTENRFWLQSLKLSNSFYNLSQDIVLLDGSHLLDGSWDLDQFISSCILTGFQVDINFQMAYPEPEIPCFKTVLSPFESQAGNQNLNNLQFTTEFWNYRENVTLLDGKAQLDGSIQLNQGFYLGPSLNNLTIQIEGRTNNTLCTMLETDNLYLIDGNVLLNGSRMLDAKKETEVL